MASATETPNPLIAIAMAMIVLRISAPHSLCKSLARGLEGPSGEWELNQTGHYCGGEVAAVPTGRRWFRKLLPLDNEVLTPP
jgi:hypothetical protein